MQIDLQGIPLEFTLDIKKLNIDSQGITSFDYPVSRTEVIEMRDALVSNFVKLYKEHQDSTEEIELFVVLMLVYLSTVMSIYQTGIIHQRLQKKGYHITYSDKYQFSQHHHNNTVPAFDQLSKLLVKGVPRSNRLHVTLLRSVWRTLKMIEWNGFKPSRWFNNENAIHCIDYTGLAKRHAQSISHKIIYSSLSDWFLPLDKNTALQSQSWKPLDSNIINDILSVTLETTQAKHFTINTKWQQFLNDWLQDSSAAVRHRLHVLSEKKNQFPKHLWTGTGGNIWNRILRHAVRKQGAIVTGHDHANGIGHLRYYCKLPNDYDSCDHFVTFTKRQADNLITNCRSDWLIPEKPPVITYIPKQNHSHSDQSAPVNTDKKQVSSVMYISSFYVGELFQFGIQIPDYIQVDWEARLFHHLNQWGYQTYHKPHPESLEMPPESLFEPFGVKRLHKPFEEVIDQVDVILFTNPQSTTVVHSLKTGVPLVFIDLGMIEWMDDAYEMIKKRCAVVKGYYDENYRAQLNWSELQSAIPDSLHKKDNTFIHEFL